MLQHARNQRRPTSSSSAARNFRTEDSALLPIQVRTLPFRLALSCVHQRPKKSTELFYLPVCVLKQRTPGRIAVFQQRDHFHAFFNGPDQSGIVLVLDQTERVVHRVGTQSAIRRFKTVGDARKSFSIPADLSSWCKHPPAGLIRQQVVCCDAGDARHVGDDGDD